MKHRRILLLFARVLILMVFLVPATKAQDVSQKKKNDKYLVDPEDFRKNIERKKNVVVLDVRTPEEFNESRIKGAVNIDYKNENFRTEIQKLDKKKRYYIYCRTGRRSSNSQELMNELGFKKVYDLKGGIVAWKKQGFEVE